MRRIGVLVVGLLVLGAVPASAADVMSLGDCNGPSRWGLGLTDVGDEIRVRFMIFGSDDDLWHIVLRHGRAGPDPFNYGDGRVFFEVTKAGPYLSPDVEVQARRVWDLEGDDGFAVKAVQQSTGQLCHVHTRIGSGPDEVKQKTCSDGARMRLELTDMGDRFKVRAEVLGSPVGHRWRIVIRHGPGGVNSPFQFRDGEVEFVGARVASENGDLAAQRSLWDRAGQGWVDGFAAKATDRQTGEVCRPHAMTI